MVPTGVQQEFTECASRYPAIRGRPEQHHVKIFADGGVSIKRVEFVEAASEYPYMLGMANKKKIFDELWRLEYINVVHHADSLDEWHAHKLFHFAFHETAQDATLLHYVDSNSSISPPTTLHTERLRHHSAIMQ